MKPLNTFRTAMTGAFLSISSIVIASVAWADGNADPAQSNAGVTVGSNTIT